MKKKQKKSDLVFYILVSAFGFLMLYPVIWMAMNSLQPQAEIFNYPLQLIGSTFLWSNFPDGWAGFGRNGFDTFFRNSLVITSFTVVGNILSASIVAYGFARLNFKFKKLLFAGLMATVMLPGQMTMIPQYVMFNNMGWVGTFLPLIIPPFLGGGAFFIFLLIQFIRGIPKELDEAAIVDGCSVFGVYFRVILPLMKPALVTVAIFAFMWTWDDFLGPLIYLNNPALHTVTLGLRNFMDAVDGTNWGPLLAMSTLSLVPQLLLFAFFQKHLIEGIATTGLK